MCGSAFAGFVNRLHNVCFRHIMFVNVSPVGSSFYMLSIMTRAAEVVNLLQQIQEGEKLDCV